MTNKTRSSLVTPTQTALERRLDLKLAWEIQQADRERLGQLTGSDKDRIIASLRRGHTQQPRMEALEQDCQHVETAQDDRCMDDMQLAHNARMAAIKECIRAVADVMRIDPDSAGGPVFDALRALAVTSTDSVIAREYKDLLEVIDHTLTVHGHMDAHTPLHDRLQRLISVSASRFNLG